MSVETRSYVMIGAKFPFAEYDARRGLLDTLRDADPGDLTIVVDGMNGEYAIVGVMIAGTTDSGHFEHVVAVEDWPADRIKALHKQIGKLFRGRDFKIRVYVFTHYS